MGRRHTLVACALLLPACSFDPSGGSAPAGGGGGGGGEGGGEGGAVIGGEDADGLDAGPIEPSARVLTATGLATTVGNLGGSGGDAFSADCGPGHLVIGLDAEDNDGGLCRLRATCGQIVVQGDSVLVVEAIHTAMFGDETSYYDIDPVDCPAGSVVVGYFGSESGDGLVHSVRLACAAVEWDGSEVTLANPVLVNSLGSPTDEGIGSGACPFGQVAAGIQGRAGTLIDRFELRCYQPAAALPP